MTPEEHRKRHKKLHESLDELLADFARHNPGKFVTQITVFELMQWSHQQTILPTEEKKQ